MMRSILVATTLFAISAPARAESNYCTTNQSGYDAVQQLEDIAKVYPKVPKKLSFPEYARCLPELREQKLVRRSRYACEAILKLDDDNRTCLDYAGTYGHRKLGGVDIVAKISTRPIDPWKLYSGHGGPDNSLDPTIEILVRFNDKATAQKLVGVWTDNLAKGKKSKDNELYQWTEWRKLAARAIGYLGGKDEREFLEEQMKNEPDAKLKAVIERVTDSMED